MPRSGELSCFHEPCPRQRRNSESLVSSGGNYAFGRRPSGGLVLCKGSGSPLYFNYPTPGVRMEGWPHDPPLSLPIPCLCIGAGSGDCLCLDSLRSFIRNSPVTRLSVDRGLQPSSFQWAVTLLFAFSPLVLRQRSHVVQVAV